MSSVEAGKGSREVSSGRRGRFLHGCLAPLARLRHPLQPLQVDERLRSTHDFRGTKADEELLRGFEGPHAHEPCADALQDVGVGSCACCQVVFPREAQRLVVEALEQQASVVDLEHVDLREVPVECGGVRNRVQPVKRMWEVDDTSLIPDCGDRLAHGEPWRNVALEKKADYLTGGGL